MALAEIGSAPQTEPPGAAASGNRVVVSAPIELFWAAFNLSRSDVPPLRGVDQDQVRARKLATRVRDMWDDGMSCWCEIFVLAARAGALDSDRCEPFLDTLPEVSRMELEGRMLTTEDDPDRDRIVARLTLLRTDPRVRSTYTRLLRSLWEVIEPVWRREGRSAMRRTAATWQAQVQRGASFPVAAELTAGNCAPHIVSLVDEAVASRRLLVAPTYIGTGYCIVDAGPATLLSSAGARATDPLRATRAAARDAATRCKALSDATRMTILALVQANPLTVGEVARRLEVSQPTVSAHFAALRGAGLVREVQEGRTVRYTLDGERLDAILDEVRTLVLNRRD